MRLIELDRRLEALFDAAGLKDYCPNGLQVEGRAEVARVLCGVTASQALLDLARDGGYDAVFVHHGYFWKGEDGRITGIRRQRLRTLLANDISLFAYHLPLDAHPELGNNAQLGRLMGWRGEGRFADQELGWIGRPGAPEGESAAQLARSIAARLGRDPLLVGDGARVVKRVAWCTGGAQGFFEQAIAAGADLYVSGEASEQTVHLARESGVPYIAAGHHATERYGVRAVARHLVEQFGLQADFVDLANPV
ncbi:Nif3-like dinuclear metal center hexameric protein [Thauera chlorobenzoica]|uniref:GTP cyclohydrolase 1 type 2 homolog n=1 Tax=Thauera chlorobenzoica TaxID=96773 RepID=A0A1H5UR23_9RHOO|nr:Nif3-like dinuclear metal center hexameric protein [Thauera chlorobenzoica]APR03509.1 NIF3-family protein [Thauera chlorobenzoica]SEF76888.1 dinuclear metal center protein, YbgI/SA1388 family [Thauera chlorobenzoica]